jgi:hypothetical protein
MLNVFPSETFSLYLENVPEELDQVIAHSAYVELGWKGAYKITIYVDF